MKLRRPPYPDPVGTAVYYLTHAGHRQTAISLAIEVLRKEYDREVGALPDDLLGEAFSAIARDWAIESLIQGAWLREYHMWELATKEYFDGQHVRSGGIKVDWKKRVHGVPAASHVVRIKEQLAAFTASMPEKIIEAIDRTRSQVNTAKHEAECFVTEDDYRNLAAAVSSFWETLMPLEEFTPPARAMS